MNLIIGSHVNFTKEKQLVGCIKQTLSYGGNAFMFYTGAPQNTNRVNIDLGLLNDEKKLINEYNFDYNNIIVHAPYIVNPANNKNKEQYLFTINFLKEEVKRVNALGVKKIVIHPGSHMGLGADCGIKNVIYVIDEILRDNDDIIICIETMAGKGNEVGKNLDEIKMMVEGVKKQNQVMVCLDTCHLSDAGYDMSNFGEFLDLFEQKIGIKKIGCVHINDSMNMSGAGKDRHQNIGFGYIGFDSLINIIYNERLKDIPKILETPYITLNDSSKDRLFPPYKEEIEMIKNKKFDPNLIEKIRKNQ